jgi:hypothetical protein
MIRDNQLHHPAALVLRTIIFLQLKGLQSFRQRGKFILSYLTFYIQKSVTLPMKHSTRTKKETIRLLDDELMVS